MQSGNKLKENLASVQKYFLPRFIFSIIVVLITMLCFGLKFSILDHFFVVVSVFIIIAYSFFSWFISQKDANKTKIMIVEYGQITFIISFLILVTSLFVAPVRSLLNSVNGFWSVCSITTIISGFITIFSRIKPVPADRIHDDTLRLKKIDQLHIGIDKNKFSIINRIPIISRIIRWGQNEGWFYSGLLLAVTSLFLFFGLNHLGKFMTVDEPKWVTTRVPQLFEAIRNHNWAATYINDKPGVLPSFISGFINFFTSYSTFKLFPLLIEKYLFLWRLPILLFNYVVLFIIYGLIKRLLTKDHAILITSLIALNPILIGISQIVNPDATLWSTGLLSVLTFLLYIKTDKKIYIYIAGFTLGLALISKYFASIFYIVYFLVIYFEYLSKRASRSLFFNRIVWLSILFIISIGTYTLLFPATWAEPTLILKGTICADILSPAIKYFVLFIFIVFTELLLLNGKLSKHLTSALRTDKIVTHILSVIFLLGFVLLFINIILKNPIFGFNQYYQYEFSRGSGSMLKTLIASGYTTLLANPIPSLLGFMLIPFAFFHKKVSNALQTNMPVIVFIYMTLAIFLIGSALGGYIADTRYQILLYPLSSILSGIVILPFIKYKKILTIVVISYSCLVLVLIQPFYFLYTNNLNIQKYTITEAWGFGGYELAQQFNSMPNAEDLSIWCDREGFGDFFVGHTYWRGETDPFDSSLDLDYLILSTGGEKIFLKGLSDYKNGKRYLYARVAEETPLLEYYKKEPYEKVCFQNNENNCVWSVKVKN